MEVPQEEYITANYDIPWFYVKSIRQNLSMSLQIKGGALQALLSEIDTLDSLPSNQRKEKKN